MFFSSFSSSVVLLSRLRVCLAGQHQPLHDSRVRPGRGDVQPSQKDWQVQVGINSMKIVSPSSSSGGAGFEPQPLHAHTRLIKILCANLQLN